MLDEASDKDICSLQQSIEQAETEWNEGIARKNETLTREKAVREAVYSKCGGMRGREQEKAQLETIRAQALQAVKEAQESLAQLEMQGKQKAELDAYYDQKVEVGGGVWL